MFVITGALNVIFLVSKTAGFNLTCVRFKDMKDEIVPFLEISRTISDVPVLLRVRIPNSPLVPWITSFVIEAGD